MFRNDKYRLYLFLFLGFAVLSSKNILIYNEETLVALSFFSFVFFVLHYFGDAIKDSLNERSQLIRQEFQNFLVLKEQSFHELLNQHEKVSNLVKALDILNTFTKSELKTLKINEEKALKNRFRSQIQNKLKLVSFSKLLVQQKLQWSLSERILSNVLVAFPKKRKSTSKGGASQNKTVENAVNSLVLNAQK